MAELKACPKCKAEIQLWEHTQGHIRGWSLVCFGCGLETPISDNKKWMITMWNRIKRDERP